MNLCTNAYQAIPQGGRLDVRIEHVAVTPPLRIRFPNLLHADYVRLTVCDTGEGISAEAMKKIFGPYYSTKEVGRGTGLGLSVVHGIVSQRGGGVFVESELGKGTNFSVFLPPIQEECVVKPDEMGDTMGAGRGTGNILYVDNEESLAVLGKKILEPYGYTVTCCSRGLDALALFALDPSFYDLLITDYSMPQIMGTRLIEEVRRICPEIPVILISGHVNGIAVEYRQEARIEAILEKPLDTEILARTVQHILC